jgi:cytochrome c oxidase cbb3-type subunit 3
VLLIFIIQLGRVFSTIAEKYGKEQAKKKWDGFKQWLLLITLSGSAVAANAQLTMPEPPQQALFLHEGFGHTAINGLVVIIVIELAVVGYYLLLIRSFTRGQKPLTSSVKKRIHFWDRMNQSVAIESEAAVMTDHEYDGIRELDNALPPWWKYGFYISIVWSFVYIGYYHVTGDGDLQTAEYSNELAEAELALEAYKAKAANAVDENSVTITSDATIIQQGGAHYQKLCKVCHGAAGEGLVGPNLTDTYWLHGGDIKAIFTTIKYGVQGKGMKSWQQELSAAELAQVANFVWSLQGTNPINGKAPEGQPYLSNPSSTDTLPSVDTTHVFQQK